jgi:hypothetical protein
MWSDPLEYPNPTEEPFYGTAILVEPWIKPDQSSFLCREGCPLPAPSPRGDTLMQSRFTLLALDTIQMADPVVISVSVGCTGGSQILLGQPRSSVKLSLLGISFSLVINEKVLLSSARPMMATWRALTYDRRLHCRRLL